MREKDYMRISELVQRSGMSRSAIHFYLREGVLHPPMRTGRTMAYYNESHLERLRTVQKMKMDMRMPIAFLKKEINELEKAEGKRPAPGPSSANENVTFQAPKSKRGQDIVKAAIQVFSQKGYHRTKVQDITQAAGISTGTFYIYFRNKRELFIEVVDDVIRTIMGEAAKAIKEEKDPVKRMVIRARVFYENYSKYNEILYQLRAEMTGDERWPQEKVKNIYHGLTKPVIRETQQLMEQGVSREVDPDLLAYALIGLIEIMSLRMTVDQKYSFEQIMAFIKDFVMNGLNPHYKGA